MTGWDAARVAEAAGARLARAGGVAGGPERVAPADGACAAAGPGRVAPSDGACAAAGPGRVVIDSRAIAPGDLFVGLAGERVDGGRFAAGALSAGAWGVLVSPGFADAAVAASGDGAVLVAADPLRALQRLATAWRRALGAQVIAVTGSVGKTSTKQLIAALLSGAGRAVAASPANLNTEIGLPLAVLMAPAGTEVLVLEMGMRGFGQIAELAAIAEPDVGVVTGIGPVHLEQVGSLDGVAQAKGELLADVRTAVVPAGERRLERWIGSGASRLSFGPDGDVEVIDAVPVTDRGSRVALRVPGGEIALEVPFSSKHQLANLAGAVAACVAVGVTPTGRVDVVFGALREERITLPSGAVLVNDCYNANPLSMRAALDDLALQHPAGRRIAVLGDMLELGSQEAEAHAALGDDARAAGVDVLVTVGPRAAAAAGRFGGESHSVPDATAAALLAAELVQPGDVVLVKASRGVALEAVAASLLAAGSAPSATEAAPHG